MGCWNNTCVLTNLPIHEGEDVYVFPIKEINQDRHRSFCYTSALYNPTMISFEAKYNDYGAGEKCKGVALPFIIDPIKKILVEKEVGENEYHDSAQHPQQCT